MESRILTPTTIIMLIASILIMFLIMRLLFKNSILYKIGISTAMVIILVSFISGIQAKAGPVHNLWAFPLQVMLAAGAYLYISTQVKRPLLEILDMVKKISNGNLHVHLNSQITEKDDELGQIAKGMQQLSRGLAKKSEFAASIGEGNLETSFDKISDEDELGDALLRMQKSLKATHAEENLRKEEDKRRNWITEGQAKFAGILRQETENMQELAFNIISNLVNYMNINQGGLFVLNDESEDRHLELLACYAYDRRKFLTKRIEIGEGLLGTCFLEGASTYITQLPQDYIRITSGLGEENPNALLLLPMKLNDEVYGVIELASLRPLANHEISFAEKVAEIVASTINALKISSRTALLLEKSQQQAEEMRAQEEEMRQNLEELNATQEALSLKEQENYKRVKKLENLNRRFAGEIMELKSQIKQETESASSITANNPG